MVVLGIGTFVGAIVVMQRDVDESVARVGRSAHRGAQVAARSSARPTARASAQLAERRSARPIARRASRPSAWPLQLPSQRGPTREESEAEHARALDALAVQRFDAAFAQETRDEEWAEATEQAISDAIAATDDALRVDSLECRVALCRVELVGDREALPSTPPFDGIAWWSGPDEGRATLMIVRDGVEPPLPRDDELG